MNNNEQIYLELEGNTNDLLMTNYDNSMKCTRLIRLDENTKMDEEIVDLCITSTNVGSFEHPFFDELLNKKIRITVTILD